MLRSALKIAKSAPDCCQASWNQLPVTLLTSVSAFCSACRIDPGCLCMQCPRCARRDTVRLLSSSPYTAGIGMPDEVLCVFVLHWSDHNRWCDEAARPRRKYCYLLPYFYNIRVRVGRAITTLPLSVRTAFGGLCLVYREPGLRVARVTTN